MQSISRSSVARARRVAAVLLVSVVVVGGVSTAAVAADGGSGSTSSTDPTSTTVSDETTPIMPPVPTSPEAGEGVSDPGPTTARTTGAGEPLRVLLEGDSITHGFNGDYTWRYRLAREFTRQRVAVDFVGSKRLPYVNPAYRTSVYAAPGFDSDHFATGGSRLYQHAAWIRAEAARQRPDVVVLAAGVNDLRAGIAPSRVQGYLQSWIANLRTVVPNVKIVLSPVLGSIDPTKPWLLGRTQAYNALLAQTAKNDATKQSPIDVSRTTNGWSASKYTTDGTHPTPTGETVIAQRIAEALHRLQVLGPVARIAGYTRWERRLAARVSVVRGHAVVRWDRQALTSVRVLERTPGHHERLLPRHYTHGSATVRLAARGHYSFRLIAVRKKMSSTPGPARGVGFRPHRR